MYFCTLCTVLKKRLSFSRAQKLGLIYLHVGMEHP